MKSSFQVSRNFRILWDLVWENQETRNMFLEFLRSVICSVKWKHYAYVINLTLKKVNRLFKKNPENIFLKPKNCCLHDTKTKSYSVSTLDGHHRAAQLSFRLHQTTKLLQKCSLHRPKHSATSGGNQTQRISTNTSCQLAGAAVGGWGLWTFPAATGPEHLQPSAPQVPKYSSQTWDHLSSS